MAPVPSKPGRGLLCSLPSLLPNRFGSSLFLIGSIWLAAPPPASAGSENPGRGWDYATSIQPLLEARCYACHGQDTRKADLDLHDAAGILKGGESGPVIVPGKPEESSLYRKVHEGEMPPKKKGTLTEREVQSIRHWIEAGATFDGAAAVARAETPEITQHDVIPILLLRCTVCHGARKQEANLDLRTRASLLRGGKSGPAFVPGRPEESLLLKRLQNEEMPPRKSLVEAMVKPMEPGEVKTLARWIELGAPEIPSAPDQAGTTSDPLVSAEDRAFWSFRPLQAVAVPASAHADQIHNPIDAFVLHQLEAAGLALAPLTDRLTLLRRASFDLTGLPPEPAEVDSFLRDESPDAYERSLDRLLASPRYGERWGRHWLDLAGYADCEGRREQHLPRPYAWRYRDYVVRAFNADKPYDRFLVEQLAGDELADYTRSAELTPELEDNLVATAFLRMAPDPTWANLTGFVPDRLEVIADAVDVLGSGVMGLTFKCARCHSHKFDPIPQRDYYRLTAIFKGAYDEHDWLKPEVNGYGGALSVGLGDRYLARVTPGERRQWVERNAQIQREIDALKAGPSTTNLTKQIKELEASRPPEPRLMALWDRGEPSPTYIYRRGNYQTPGPPVAPGLPSVLVREGEPFQPQPPWPGAQSTGRRLAFAQWLVAPGQPLTARVMVNRIWQHHFGRGIVRSLGNFGKTGDRPTHPELLDWLATEFIRQGWSIKALHRLIMSSHTYQQSSAVTVQLRERDPANRLWSRMPMRRLGAEELRDSLLWVAGQLDETRFGPAEPVTVRADGLVLAGRRRSIYVQQLRKQPPSLMESFDLPAMNPNCLQRSESLVAPQALHLLNDQAIRDLARRFADQVARRAGSDPRAQVRQVFWSALTRPPTEEELAICLESLAGLTTAAARDGTGSDPAAPPHRASKALASFCHGIMNSAAFLYLD